MQCRVQQQQNKSKTTNTKWIDFLKNLYSDLIILLVYCFVIAVLDD